MTGGELTYCEEVSSSLFRVAWMTGADKKLGQKNVTWGINNPLNKLLAELFFSKGYLVNRSKQS